MTKRSIRKAPSLGLAMLLGVCLIPAATQAQSVRQREAVFCSQQVDRQSNILQEFTKRAEAYETAVTRQTDAQAARRQKLSERLIETRLRADEKRSGSFAIMEQGRPDDASRSRVRAYADAVDAAVQQRRSAYDQARLEFQRSVDDLLKSRDESMRAAMTAFRQTAEDALETAVRQCESGGTEAAEVRRSLIAALRQARLSFNDKLQARPDFRAEVRAAATARNAAFDAATESFQVAMQQLRATYSELP